MSVADIVGHVTSLPWTWRLEVVADLFNASFGVMRQVDEVFTSF